MVSRILKIISYVICIASLVAGCFYGSHNLNPATFTWESSSDFDSIFALIFWIVGTINGFFIFAFGHLIDVLEDIRDNRK